MKALSLVILGILVGVGSWVAVGKAHLPMVVGIVGTILALMLYFASLHTAVHQDD